MMHDLSRKPHLTTLIGSVFTAILISGCGGGAIEDRVVSINSISSQGTPAYNNPSTFIVQGTNLHTGLMVSTEGCNGASILNAGETKSLQVTCTPSRAGNITINLNSTDGVTLRSQVFDVPKPLVRFNTSLGSLLIELEPTKAPITVSNFLSYINDGFFNNTVFHRVYPIFVAQAGAYTFDTNYVLKTPTRPPIALERTTVTGLSNTARTVGMARTDIPDSATSQFFINFSDNLFLNAQFAPDGNGYAVFGTIINTQDIDSYSTLDALKAIQLISNGDGEISLPSNPPVIFGANRIR